MSLRVHWLRQAGALVYRTYESGAAARCASDPAAAFDTCAWKLLQKLTAETEPLLQHGVATLSKLKRLPSALAATAQAMLAPEGAAAGNVIGTTACKGA